MKKSKYTKRALLASVLALMLCAAMLVGSTFAWFTDSVTSGKNQIVAGNLDVELEYQDAGGNWLPVGTETNLFRAADTTKWEPGHTEYVQLRIRNAGSLALKYSFTANVFADEAGKIDERQYTAMDGNKFKLSDYLVFSKTEGADKVTDRESLWIADEAAEKALMGTKAFANLKMQSDKLLPGVAEEFTLAVYMPTWVGNEANQLTSAKEAEGEPTIYFGLNLFATQTPHEKDSFGENYDASAELPTLVTSPEELADAIKNAKPGDVIELQNSVALTTPLTIDKPITINGNGRTISGQNIKAIADVKFENVVLSKPTNANNNATLVYAQAGCKNLTFENVTFTDPQWEAIQVTSNELETLTVNNCTFTAAHVEGVATEQYGNQADQAIRFIHYEATGNATPVVDFTITNNKFENCDKVIAPIGIFYIGEGSKLTASNNTFDYADNNAAQNLIFGWPAMEELKVPAKWGGSEPTTYTYAKPVVEPDDPFEEADKKAAEAGNAYRKADGTYGTIKPEDETDFLIDVAYEGNEVTLIKDIGAASSYSSSKQADYSNKNSVFDLNGHTYTFGQLELTQNSRVVAEDSSLEIKNGTMQGTINFEEIFESYNAMQKVTLDHVNMKWDNPRAWDADKSNYRGLILSTKTSGSVFTVKDCVLDCNASFSGTASFDLAVRPVANLTNTVVNGRLNGQSLIMNVEGCTVNGEVYCNSSYSCTTTVNINNSIINGNAYFDAGSDQKNEVTITNTTINGDLQTNFSRRNVHITLTDVTVTGTLCWANPGLTSAVRSELVTIVSGTFGFDPGAYLASGSTAVNNGNGTWTVTAG